MITRDDPVLVLEWYIAARAHPERGEIGFEEDDLERFHKVWSMACLAAHGDSEIATERDRFATFRKQLFDDSVALTIPSLGRAAGFLRLDEKDWAETRVIKRAIRALKREGIRVLAA